MKTISGLEELSHYVGKEIGVSDWLKITQERINAFAEATGDYQWIHVDVERAKKESPYKVPVAHGFLTLSLAPKFINEVYRVEGIKLRVNYGLNKVRFTGPVPAESRIRMRITLGEFEKTDSGAKTIMKLTFEREGQEKPVCVAESVTLWYT
jgi:acyl dehydratase